MTALQSLNDFVCPYCRADGLDVVSSPDKSVVSLTSTTDEAHKTFILSNTTEDTTMKDS